MNDPELSAMQAVSAAFKDLDPETQARILRWAADRYTPDLKVFPDIARPGEPKAAEEPAESERRAASNGSTVTGHFEHFADLYDAVSPKTNADKALVAGYWFQKHLGQPSFASQPLNNELKNLGHGLDRINDALASNASQKPSLVLQVRKAGNAPQARKTYKLTSEGIRKVERMVSGRDE